MFDEVKNLISSVSFDRRVKILLIGPVGGLGLMFQAHAGELNRQGFSDTPQINLSPTVAAEMNPRERYLAADDRDVDSARREYVRDLRERHGDPGERADHHDPLLGYRFTLRANRIFREWNPIGFISDDLRTVLGEPHRKVEANERHFALLWEYNFVVGPAGAHWRIGIDANDRIVAIQYIPGE